jgi:two-component system phosphate regulon response regulator PhoB
MSAPSVPSVPNSVLIADDDEDIRMLVSLMLARAGYETDAVDGGIPVLAAVDGSACPDDLPGLFVLDVRMPDVNGLDLCRRLKADPQTATRPVLLISAESSASDIAAGFAAGCDDYLPKPFAARELVRRVELLLGAARGLAVRPA